MRPFASLIVLSCALVAAGCGHQARKSSAAPERDLTLTSGAPPAPEVVSAVELAGSRPTHRVASVPKAHHPEHLAARTVDSAPAPDSSTAITVTTVLAAAPASLPEASSGAVRQLLAGQTARSIPVVNLPSGLPNGRDDVGDGNDRAMSGRGIHGGMGGRCRPRRGGGVLFIQPLAD